MITEVLIKNFKCFKQLTLPDLGRITLIGGRNNVGKTALMEALFLFFDRSSPIMILRQYGWRGIEKINLEPEAMWAPIFYNYDMNREILISPTINREPQAAKFRFNQSFSPPPSPNVVTSDTAPSDFVAPGERQIPTDEESISSASLDIEYYAEEDVKQLSHLFVNAQHKPALHVEFANIKTLPAVFFPSKQHITMKQTADFFSHLAEAGRENEVVDFLGIIEPRLLALKVITKGPTSSVHGQLKGFPRTLPIHLMGEGMEKLLNLIIGIANSKGGCVFVDEMENGIYFEASPKIWEAIGNAAENYNCQVIATTHSYECLEAAHRGLASRPDDLRYIRLDREGDVITAKTSNYDMLGSAIAHNMEIR
ncbi:MAG: AAA family ATPase [Planctomycetota bacterium]|nr:AAA family ATPase [Planctomycetota bacterium]